MGDMSCVVVGGGAEGWRWRRRRKGMGEQGEMGEEKRNLGGNHFWQSGGSQSGCVNVCVCVFSLFFFCNFIQFGRSRRSARANNSLQTADVITF